MTTINKKEIQKFSNLADEWWDVNGKFKPLHIFNPVRIDYITEKITEHYNFQKKDALSLSGLKILDIGCGGGLVSEPMCRLGAKVTGIDASEKNIKIADLHAQKNKLKIKYLNTSPENFPHEDKFDVILNLEIVEHVENLDLYIEACSKLLKPNGLMFTATLNRTFESYIKAIVGAEYVMRWLPIGTHDWNKFIKPDELKKKLEKYNFSISDTEGVVYSIFLRKWKRSNDCAVNYIVTSIKH